MQKYEVKPGDTLYGISNQFGVSVTELANMNNVNADTLKIGQILQIPTNSGTNPNTMFMYTIKPGDTLYSIAKKYNTTADEIVKLNYLNNSSLQVGQIIRIPEMYTKEDQMVLPNYTNYTVKPGDTLYSIARNNNINIDTIIKDNSLINNNLNIGQILKLRILNKDFESIEECYGDDYTPPDNEKFTNYTVKKNDTLYSIAKNFNTTVTDIINLNNLSNSNLNIGQILKIPNQNSIQTQTYIVKSGDNLYTIAKKFNTTVSDIKSKNNLNSNLLSIGQNLKI